MYFHLDLSPYVFFPYRLDRCFLISLLRVLFLRKVRSRRLCSPANQYPLYPLQMPRHSTKHDSADSYSQYPSSQYLSDSSQSTSPPSSTSASFNQPAQPSPQSGTKKKHVCGTCERGFTTSGHLARHLRVHTGERNHKCPFPGCETRCSRQDNLQQQ